MATAGAQAEPGFSVEVTPTRVIDGQEVAITVRSRSGSTVNYVEARQCRLGVEYRSSTGGSTAPDFNDPAAGNCPFQAVSTRGDPQRTWGPTSLQRVGEPEGQKLLFHVGEGVVQWPRADGGETSLTCGVGNPCALVVQVNVQRDGETRGTWYPVAKTLTFEDTDPLAGCGGGGAWRVGHRRVRPHVGCLDRLDGRRVRAARSNGSGRHPPLRR